MSCGLSVKTFVTKMAPNVEGVGTKGIYFLLAKLSQFDQSLLVEKDFPGRLP